jgi:hypothetical protein
MVNSILKASKSCENNLKNSSLRSFVTFQPVSFTDRPKKGLVGPGHFLIFANKKIKVHFVWPLFPHFLTFLGPISSCRPQAFCLV